MPSFPHSRIYKNPSLSDLQCIHYHVPDYKSLTPHSLVYKSSSLTLTDLQFLQSRTLRFTIILLSHSPMQCIHYNVPDWQIPDSCIPWFTNPSLPLSLIYKSPTLALPDLHFLIPALPDLQMPQYGTPWFTFPSLTHPLNYKNSPLSQSC